MLRVAFQALPDVERTRTRWLVAYQEAQGDPRDQGDTPSGPMRRLRNRLYEVLGFNRLEDYSGYLNRVEDSMQMAANG